MKALIRASVEHARTVVALLILLLIAGAYAYTAIPKESDPDVNIPIIYVSLHLDGIAPADAERLLIRPMEQELQTIEGVKEMSATAYEGGGNVILEFDAGFNSDIALDDVREAVDRAKVDLPDEADEPTVNEVNLSLFPVIIVTLHGDVPERTLLRLSRDLQDRIEAIPAVLEASISGDREEVVEILIDPIELESYNLASEDVLNVVSRSNRLVAAGNMDSGEGRFAIKVPGLLEDLDDILTLPLSTSGDSVVTVGDVAEVRRTFKDPDAFARLNGAPAISLNVSKRTGEGVIEAINQVRQVVAEESQFWPDQVQVTFSQDRSTDIRIMLTDLQNNVISAVLLVMVVIVAALGVRSAGFVGVAIPGSFLTGILVLMAMGLTVNVVVLFALILAVGMLVDGAIVVTEFADRKMAEGLPRQEAYIQAAQRMAWPITASTATTLAAFTPLLFWPGIVGEFMKYLPITLVAVLAASLMMALIFVPTLGAILGKPSAQTDAARKQLANSETGDVETMTGFTGLYVRFLRAALKRSGIVAILAVVALGGTWTYYATHGNGVEFFPEVEPNNVLVLVHARGNLSIEEQDMLVAQVEERVLRFSDMFEAVNSQTGGGDTNQMGSDMAEDVIGQISIELAEWDQRPLNADEILAEIRTATADLAGVYIEARKQEQGPPVGKPIQVELSSRFPELLEPAVAELRAFVDSMDGLVDIEDSRPLPGIDWELTVDRAQAAKFGADVTSIGSAIRMVTNGQTVGTYRPNDSDDEIDLVVRYPERWRTLDMLDHVRVITDSGPVPVSNFVERRAVPQTGTINRVDSARVMTVKADVAPGVLADEKVQAIRDWLAANPLDSRITVGFAGEDEEAAAAQEFLSKAFLVALFLMAIILITQFNSLYGAFLILSAVIMSTVGVLIGLLATGQPFGIVMTGVGVIALAGIVVNNNIVLIDTYDQIKKTAKTPMEAILRTGAQRLRPVFLTTVTTILGLMPMVLSTNIDFVNRSVSVGAPSTQWWVGLSTAIVFGLAFATILTLVITPCALMLRARFDAWRARRRDRAETRRAEKAAKAQGATDAPPTPANLPVPQAAE